MSSASEARMCVAPSGALKDAVPIRVDAFGRGVVLVRHLGNVYALDDLCPHRGGPMHCGEVASETLSCPLHGWRFALSSGVCVEGPETLSGVPKLETFEVIEHGGWIYLQRPSS